MLAKRLRMVSIFAGGCLSGAVLIVLFRGHSGTLPDERARPRTAEYVVEPSLAEDRGPAYETAPEATAVDDRHESEHVNPPSAGHVAPAAKDAEAVAETPAAEAGSAVSDVLARLEAAYRERLVAVRPSNDAPASTTVALAPAAAPPALAVAAPALAVAAPALTVAAPVLAVAAPAGVAPPLPATPVALPPTAPLVATRGGAVPNPAPAAPAAPAAPVALPAQNVSIGSVHQGDTYNVQQVAVMQYVPVFQPWPYAGYGGYGYPSAGAHAPRQTQPKRVPYPSTLTNPDNPWGYNFPPSLEMVK